MNKPRLEVAVGFFVLVGFLIFSIIVFFVSGIYFFRPGYHLSAQFDYVGIINKGAPVRFSGVRVGEVSKVRILKPQKEGESVKVEITFFVEKGVVVHEHYKFSVQGTHIMSEPHIAITPVVEGGRILKDGDVVADGISPPTLDDLIKQGNSIMERVDLFTKSITDAFGDQETLKLLKSSLVNMNQLLTSMNEITGGQEKDLRTMASNLNRVTQKMDILLGRINQAEGTLGKLVVEDELYNDLRDFTADIKKHPWKLFKKE
ncbi:MAG: MCE family protein [Candidatus Omnitrophica bacterium]|nr:MCE family protein [Candidatus Omnitrophota bacterium]